VTTGLMKEQFPSIVDVAFTAGMEKQLDAIEAGSDRWQDILRAFYTDFDSTLTQAEKNMEGKRLKVPDEVTDVICELCGRNMVIKSGRFGKFLACPAFPNVATPKKSPSPPPAFAPSAAAKCWPKRARITGAISAARTTPAVSL
jgi:DNA topoisomerase-1